MPASSRPYLYLARLDRPIGTWLLFLPAVWAIFLSGRLNAWPYVALFGIGSLVMRSAGCVINDLWDRNLDGRVERTQSRPLAAGDVTVKQALAFLALLLLGGLVILLQLNPLTIALGFLSMLFVISYPLMKRITWWPQAFLGLTFNFGALMGWAAVAGEVEPAALLLYCAGIFWTLGYDTIYAFQDRADDMIVGIKSAARLLTERSKLPVKGVLGGFYMIHTVLITAALYAMSFDWSFMVLLIIPFAHLGWQVITLDIDNPQNSLKRFRSNRDYGLILALLILLCSL